MLLEAKKYKSYTYILKITTEPRITFLDLQKQTTENNNQQVTTVRHQGWFLKFIFIYQVWS